MAPFYDAMLPIDHISLTLDFVTSFLQVITRRNTLFLEDLGSDCISSWSLLIFLLCKHLRYSQAVGGISSKLEESE